MEAGLQKRWIHLCIDMQNIFAEDTLWHVPWMKKVSPDIAALAQRHAERTIFTRFITPQRPDQMPGLWRQYYEKWWMMTGEHVDPALMDLMGPLKALVPPARVFDKMTYSPWTSGRLNRLLSDEGVETVVLTGGETDVCVMAAALGAIDLGYHVILLKDAVCSGADSTHDAGLKLLGERFSAQLEVTTIEEFLSTV